MRREPKPFRIARRRDGDRETMLLPQRVVGGFRGHVLNPKLHHSSRESCFEIGFELDVGEFRKLDFCPVSQRLHAGLNVTNSDHLKEIDRSFESYHPWIVSLPEDFELARAF